MADETQTTELEALKKQLAEEREANAKALAERDAVIADQTKMIEEQAVATVASETIITHEKARYKVTLPKFQVKVAGTVHVLKAEDLKKKEYADVVKHLVKIQSPVLVKL
ncbi:hypothetical protein SAMN05421823_102533 [Catalinimonas alkaloidigena]|uniref:Uncharacterized protein n=1 Tax=Catalinimonas alkaloidigena TaxID=1075417 RepID=A0A1G9B8E1_9BACT|nr:hypothetical protein [Catalinimonas alkaloidigena]SDK35290.1 hypothetical protein SAMN05421823_102533 [Catalinimonas alkaloidigena]